MSPLADFFSTVDFYDLFTYLLDGGWIHYLFPFLFVYAIVFTILNQVKIFEDYKPTKIIIAFIFGIFAVGFPITDDRCGTGWESTITPGCTLGDYMLGLFPGVSAFAVAILALYIVSAMLGFDLMKLVTDENDKVKPGWLFTLFGIGAAVVIIFTMNVFGDGGRYSDFWLWDLLKDPFLYMIIIFVLLFLWINSGPGEDPDSLEKRAKEKREKRKAEEG